MKIKLLLLSSFLVNTMVAATQEKFSLTRFNVNVGYGARFNKINSYFNTNKGLTGFIETEYLLLNNQTVGIKAEYSFLCNSLANKSSNGTSLFNAAYYLTSNLFFKKKINKAEIG